MKAILLKTPKGLIGSTPDDHEAWTKFRRRLETMKEGTWLRFEWSSPRNGKHHRKLMALLELIAENSEVWDTKEKALHAVKLVAGHFDLCVNPLTGEIQQVTKSIDFESMDQEAFEKFYKAAIDGVIHNLLPQLDEQTADRLLEMILQGWGQ
ncbi:DUF1367 family protein [Polynucleobacter sp. AP-RePozz3-80-G7]|uniref:DUF1367 family protein n=1 Tax=Polynucleobacter sp. AP-RePozz3-80-G7 TaxID=2689105 RepID=UPI001C0DFEFF|nr:DUF1367 family protein [Polynucleobacter sp. AP-RePozz3-80-G7]MBU3640000.1 DUF1367 family protein [Polynucleobacter sp. AP-RePozz3-80-G7]